MIRNQLSMLEYEAKRHPELAEMIADIDQLSDEQIRASRVKLPWMRQALLLLKQERMENLLAASMDQWVIDGHAADPLGEMRRWEGVDSFVQVGRSCLEVRYGQLVWLDQDGVWIDTIRSTVIDPILHRNTVSCGTVSRSQYMAAVRAAAKKLCPETIEAQPIERVRFFRPG